MSRRFHGIVIVFDTTDQVSFNNVKQWLKEVDQFSGESVLKIIAGNNCDLSEKREVFYDTAMAFCDSISLPFIETSARDSTNVDELFLQLAQQIMSNLPPEAKHDPTPFILPIIKREETTRKSKHCLVS